ncbi:hypothetical protein HDA32_004778 [Spinactinospora alkalitolerans]|uniref:Uncharacterized protein n=1 Tax=Spinactinospora alkalitolerans TaxID=687207 RepID=A0A852U0D8_9ACTN|nr:hypothetical protein [Spinactinospora alkalitolerans]NYE49658.1 hypothetical protein [Spinactinospora alkalitolerans]
MNSRRGHELAPTRFPLDVQRRLAALDRLREIWADHQTRRPGHLWADDRRRLFRRHVLELRALAGQGGVASPAAARMAAQGWDAAEVDDALRERLRHEEQALVAMAADCRAGQPLTADYLGDLARTIPDFDEPVPAHQGTGEYLAEAAAVETHPVIRAAHLQLMCERALESAGQRTPAGPPLHHRPLPWAVASLSLMRSNYPPLIMDRRLAAPHDAARSRADEEARLAGLVCLLAELEIAALRGELSWAARASGQPPANTAPLATAIHRRLLEHLRHGAGSLRLVLRELDPGARAAVDAGDIGDDERHRGRLDAAAERAMFSRGPGCWWVSLDLTVADAALRLLLAVQDVGTPATGVLAVTADARLLTDESAADVLDLACTDCVTLIPTDSAGERWPAVEEFADDAISRAVNSLTRALR